MACRVAPLHSWADWHGCEAAAPRAMCSPAAGLASHTCWQALRHLALVAERLQQRKRRSTSTPSSDASIFDPSRWSREPRRRLPSRPAPGESRSPPSPGALGRAGEPSVPLYKAAVATSGPFGRVDMCAPGRKGAANDMLKSVTRCVCYGGHVSVQDDRHPSCTLGLGSSAHFFVRFLGQRLAFWLLRASCSRSVSVCLNALSLPHVPSIPWRSRTSSGDTPKNRQKMRDPPQSKVSIRIDRYLAYYHHFPTICIYRIAVRPLSVSTG